MSELELVEQIERAFAYRGNVTVARHDGAVQIGFIFDRTADHVEMFDELGARRILVPIAEIAQIALTGEDVAAKAQRTWERRHGELESRAMSRWGDWEHERPVLIVVALPMELRAAARALGAPRPSARALRVSGRWDRPVVVRAIGIAGGAAQAIADERPGLVISCGFAGALTPTLTTGELVLATSVRDEREGAIAAPGELLRAARRVVTASEGEIVCPLAVAATGLEKAELVRPGRIAVDLESWMIARAAERAGVPWLALRAVLDPLELDLPDFAREAHASYLRPALRHALSGPRAVVALADLAVRSARAARALTAALARLAPAIAATHARVAAGVP